MFLRNTLIIKIPIFNFTETNLYNIMAIMACYNMKGRVMGAIMLYLPHINTARHSHSIDALGFYSLQLDRL